MLQHTIRNFELGVSFKLHSTKKWNTKLKRVRITVWLKNGEEVSKKGRSGFAGQITTQQNDR